MLDEVSHTLLIVEDEVDIVLQVETRGPEHREAVVVALEESGYSLVSL